MRKELLHLYGPLSIHSYGTAIVIGLVLFIWRIKKHPQAAHLKLTERIDDLMLIGIAAGVLGGRLLYVLTEPDSSCYFSYSQILWNFISFWDGGFSLLGTILAILFSLAYYLKKTDTAILPFLDLIAIHAPILQSASRVGCFFAGCCYGAATQLPWGVVYTDSDSIAPLCVALHPTQLYSALTLFIIFLLLQLLQNILKKPGQLLAAYLLLVSMERFMIDFWRNDRTFVGTHVLSSHQLLALFIFCGAGILCIWSSFRKNTMRD